VEVESEQMRGNYFKLDKLSLTIVDSMDVEKDKK
jgi:hypothetical protein